MTDWVGEILTRYGQTALLKRDGGETAIRAFLQPVTERDESIPETMTPLGWIDGRLWLYLGRTEVLAGELLSWRGMEFRVRSCRSHYIGDTLCHWRAVLEPAKEAAD